jgi:hypothetical protein
MERQEASGLGRAALASGIQGLPAARNAAREAGSRACVTVLATRIRQCRASVTILSERRNCVRVVIPGSSTRRMTYV